jgi:hypothetical protein
MRSSIIVVDHFYNRPDAIRRYALGQSYYYPYQRRADVESGLVAPTWRASMFREAVDCPFKSSEALIRSLESLTGETVDRHHWNLSFPTDDEGRPAGNYRDVAEKSCIWNCAFHFKPKTGQQLGQGVHNHVTDTWNSVGVHGWAGLIYLNPAAPMSGGLSLWQNRDPAHTFDWMTPPSEWILQDTFANVYNRLILVRGNIPHSGADGWGDTIESGRLYQTFFFKVLRARRPQSLELESLTEGSTPGSVEVEVS